VLTGNAPLPNAAPMSPLRFEPGVGHDGKLRRSILIWVGRTLPGGLPRSRVWNYATIRDYIGEC
jgi:hypothetical protein